MKVIYDHKIFSQPFGGISRYYKTLASQLLENGEDVQIIPGLHLNNYLKDLSGNLVNGIKIKSFPANTARIINLLNHTFCELEIKFQKPDIVHETYYSALPHLKTNSVRVTSVYDMIHELYVDDFSINDKTSFLKNTILPIIQDFKNNNNNYSGLELILSRCSKINDIKISAGEGLFTHKDYI